MEEPIYFGFLPGGETAPGAPNWDPWIFGLAPGASAQNAFGSNFYNTWSCARGWTPADFDFDRDFSRSRRRPPPLSMRPSRPFPLCRARWQADPVPRLVRRGDSRARHSRLSRRGRAPDGRGAGPSVHAAVHGARHASLRRRNRPERFRPRRTGPGQPIPPPTSRPRSRPGSSKVERLSRSSRGRRPRRASFRRRRCAPD